MFRRFYAARLPATIFAGGLAAVLSLSVGCGGSSSSPTKPSNRAVLINAVQAARLSTDIFRVSDYSGEEVSRKVLTRVRTGFAKSRAEDASEGYDEEQNLYYYYEAILNGFRIIYYKDAARTQPAGYIIFRQENETTIHFVFRITEGKDPFYGDINLVLDAPESDTGRLYGDLSDPLTGTRVVFDFQIHDSKVTQGAFTARSAGITIAFENFTSDKEGKFNASIRYGSLTGSVEQNADTAGRLTLTDTTGTTVAEYDADGKGIIKLPNNQTIEIPDFDLDDSEK